jgi:CO/xanthine dehydrogenase FAD-binding subunit
VTSRNGVGTFLKDHAGWILTAASIVAALILFASHAIAAGEVAPVAERLGKAEEKLQAQKERIDTMAAQVDWLYRNAGGPRLPEK